MSVSEEQVLEYFETLSNWGRWGPDDELGTLNFVTPEHRRRAALLVSEGVTVSCERRITVKQSEDNPQPLLRFMMTTGEGLPDKGWAGATDWVGMPTHGRSITHLDALGHIFWNNTMYNGRSPSVVKALTGVGYCSIEAVRDGIVTRGVLLDIPRSEGVDWIEPLAGISPEMLERAEERQGVRVGNGDALLVRTGRDTRHAAQNHLGEEKPGLEADCLPWLAEREVALLVSDEAHDITPGRYSIRTPIHTVGIVMMGLWLLDNALLDPLASHCQEIGRWEFLFNVLPLQLQKASASPVNPVAVF
jgi:kynurenine formamidase